MSDKTNPSHYKGFSNGAQPVDIAERLNFNRGTALVYIARAGRKQGESAIDDLEKASWFLQREIDRLITDGKEVAAAVQKRTENEEGLRRMYAAAEQVIGTILAGGTGAAS